MPLLRSRPLPENHESRLVKMGRRCSIIVQQAHRRRVWVLRAVASPRVGPSASKRIPFRTCCRSSSRVAEYRPNFLRFLMHASSSSLHRIYADFAFSLTKLRTPQILFAWSLQHLRLAHMLPPCGKTRPRSSPSCSQATAVMSA